MSIRHLGRVIAAVFALFLAAAATSAAAQTYTLPFTVTGTGGTTGSGTVVLDNSTNAPNTISGTSNVVPVELVSATFTLNTIAGGAGTTTFNRSDLSGFRFARDGGGTITDLNFWASTPNGGGYTLNGFIFFQSNLAGTGSDSLTFTPGVAFPTPTVPTLSEWAMILFGVLLAGGAAVYVQRRRLTA